MLACRKRLASFGHNKCVPPALGSVSMNLICLGYGLAAAQESRELPGRRCVWCALYRPFWLLYGLLVRRYNRCVFSDLSASPWSQSSGNADSLHRFQSTSYVLGEAIRSARCSRSTPPMQLLGRGLLDILTWYALQTGMFREWCSKL